MLALAALFVAVHLWWQSLARKACRLGPQARCVIADLSAMELGSAELHGEELRPARWLFTQLEIANLAGACLVGSLLIGVDLERASLRGDQSAGVVCR